MNLSLNKHIYLKIIIGVFLLIYLILLCHSYENHAAPFYEDETTYVNVAKLFYETNSLKSIDISSEDVSKIGEFNWYGPGYGLFYGSIAKVVRSSNLFFPIINFVLLIGVMLSINFMSVSNDQKNKIRLALLICPPFLEYTFTYFPEVLHLLFSSIQTIVLIHIYVKHRSNERYKSTLLIFITITLFFSIFRITHIFFIIGILPLFRSRKQLLYLISVCILFAIWGAFFQLYFVAAAWVPGMSALEMILKGDFYKGFLLLNGNIVTKLTLLISEININVYIQLTLFITFCLNYIKTKNEFVLSIIFIFIVYYSVLIIFYTTDQFFYNKQTACLFPLLIISYFSINKSANLWPLILVLAISPNIIFKTLKEIGKKIQSRDLIVSSVAEKSLKEILSCIKYKKTTTIMWYYYDWKKPTVFLTNLPIYTKDGNIVRYTTNIVDTLKPDSIKFKEWGKIPINYILSKKQLLDSNLKLSYKNKYFMLYENLKPITKK